MDNGKMAAETIKAIINLKVMSGGITESEGDAVLAEMLKNQD